MPRNINMKKLTLLLALLFVTPAFGQSLPVMTSRPELWSGCGTATASTANVAINAAVASGYIYVTSFSCASSDADNATNINFKDGTAVIAVGGVSQMATASNGCYSTSFTAPLRLSKNTALNFNTDVSTSSVVCCANGYVSAT